MKSKEMQSRDIEIKIVPMLKELLRKAWLIALVGLLTAVAVYGAAKVMVKPEYRCGFTAYVNNQQAQSNKDVLTNSDLVASQHLTKTFSAIIRSNTVLSASLETVDSDLTHGQFKAMVSTEIQEGTEVISVYVINKDPQLAYALANAIAQTAPAHMASIVEGSSMRIIDYPEYSEKRYRPNYSRYAMLGFLAGALIVVVILVIRFLGDDTVHSEDEVESRFDIPILGIIPDASVSKSKDSDYYYYSEYGSKNEAEVRRGDYHEK